MKDLLRRFVVRALGYAHLLAYGAYPPGTLVQYTYTGSVVEKLLLTVYPDTFPREGDLCMILQQERSSRSDPIAILCQERVIFVQAENLKVSQLS